jgi:glycosyltransferase involved in cell wall biosynthesis
MPDSSLELTILMPCLNEAETLRTCVLKAKGFLESEGIDGEVLIADNGSTDGSRDIAVEAGARVVAVDEKGYGATLQGGIKAARGGFVIMGDADDSYDFTGLMPFVEELRQGSELVMGNRFKGGIAKGAMPFLHRYLGNPVLTRIGRWLFHNHSCGDFHCGLRGFDREAVERLNLRTTGMEFASEMVMKATIYGLRVAEVPTTLSPDGRTRAPHLRTWRDGWRHLRFMLLYSPTWVFLLPGLLLMAAGALVGFLVMFPGRHLGDVGLDIHTLMYASAMIIVGYQAVVFSVFTRVFAINSGLVPYREQLASLCRHLTLESGLLAGGGLVVGGAFLSVFALWHWHARGFGELDPRYTMRIVIPAATLLALGCQTVFSSFFLSILGLQKK